jgi:release factor glutamine methyltransferase
MTSPDSARPLTIGKLRRQLTSELRSVSGENAAVEAARLIGEVIGASPTRLTLRSNETLTSEQAKRLRSLLRDRLTGSPMAYVLGHIEFHGHDLLCDKRALIPRPETEIVVDIALRELPAEQPDHTLRVVDVGTGSGNIAIAIAHARSDVVVTAIDSQHDALTLARANVQRLGLSSRITLIEGNRLDPIPEDHSADLIVSNPPYVAVGDPSLEKSVRDFEPHAALFAGTSGLDVITHLLHEAPARLGEKGGLVCEIGHDQKAAVARVVQSVAGWEIPTFHQDLAGTDRVLLVRRR